jgi:hypothetical protein
MTWIERKQGMDAAPGRDRYEIREGWVRRMPMCLGDQGPAVSNGFCFDSPVFCFFAFEKRDPRIALSTSDI